MIPTFPSIRFLCPSPHTGFYMAPTYLSTGFRAPTFPPTYMQGFMWFLLTLPLYVAPPWSLCQELIIALPILPPLLMRRPIFHPSGIHCSILMWNVYVSISAHGRKMASFLQPIDFCPPDPSESRKRLGKISERLDYPQTFYDDNKQGWGG